MFMLRVISVFGAMLAATILSVASAPQTLAQDVSGNPTPQEYIDAHRPVIAPRQLTADEKATVKRMADQFRKKGYRPTEEMLHDLHAIAVSGDKTAMAAMMTGWDNCGSWKTKLLTDYDLIAYDDACNQLSALWAMKLWVAGEHTRDVARSMMGCLESKQFATYGEVKGRRCGVNAEVDADFDSAIDRFADGEDGTRPPRRITFTEYALAPKLTAEQLRAKFDEWVAAYSKGERPSGDKDARWIDGYISRQGPAVYKEWVDALEKFWTIENARTGAERVAGEEAHKQRIAEWEALNAARAAAKAKGEGLPAAEEERFVGLSFRLKGKYIVPYGMENVLRDQWAIDDFCGNGPASICDRQRNLAFARENAAMEERVSRENAWNIRPGGGDVSVRSYDQNGNYLGASNVPAWQADILKGN
jgi:hypothetical protein